MMKDMKFRVKSPEHSKAIQEKLFELGYTWSGSSMLPQHDDSNFLFASNEYASISHERNDEKFFENHNYTETTLDDLYEIDKPLIIQLNGEYTATINKDGTVQVGCTTFTQEQIKRFIKAYKKAT